MTHQRAQYMLSVKVNFSRARQPEQINGENLKGILGADA